MSDIRVHLEARKLGKIRDAEGEGTPLPSAIIPGLGGEVSRREAAFPFPAQGPGGIRPGWRWPMRRVGLIAVLALAVTGCAPTGQERLREYNEDGIHLFQEGSYRYAGECFQAALALRPGDPDLVYNLAQCKDRLGQEAQAEQMYGQCLARAPNHPECRHALAVLLVRQGRRAEARRLIEDWLKREPNRAAPYAEDGWLRAQDGDLLNARGRLEQGLL